MFLALVRGRLDKYKDYAEIELCRSAAALNALRAHHGANLKACAEALRDQIRVRVHAWRVKQKDLPHSGDDKGGVVVERLMSEFVPVVATFLEGKPCRRSLALFAWRTQPKLVRRPPST